MASSLNGAAAKTSLFFGSLGNLKQGDAVSPIVSWRNAAVSDVLSLIPLDSAMW